MHDRRGGTHATGWGVKIKSCSVVVRQRRHGAQRELTSIVESKAQGLILLNKQAAAITE
jgi:hypothetical protein